MILVGVLEHHLHLHGIDKHTLRVSVVLELIWWHHHILKLSHVLHSHLVHVLHVLGGWHLILVVRLFRSLVLWCEQLMFSMGVTTRIPVVANTV